MLYLASDLHAIHELDLDFTSRACSSMSSYQDQPASAAAQSSPEYEGEDIEMVSSADSEELYPGSWLEISSGKTLAIYADASVNVNDQRRISGLGVVVSRIDGGFDYQGMACPPPHGPIADCSMCPESKALSLALRTVIERDNSGLEVIVIHTDSARSIKRMHDVLDLDNSYGDRLFDSTIIPRDAPWRPIAGRHIRGWDAWDAYFRGDWAIAKDNVDMVRYIHRQLGKDVRIVWIPSHFSIDGNERADLVANHARRLATEIHDGGFDLPSWTCWRASDPPFVGQYSYDEQYSVTRNEALAWTATHPSGQTLMPPYWGRKSIDDYLFDETLQAWRRANPRRPWQ